MMRLFRRALRRLRRDAGSTIPEVMVALLIMSVAILGVIGSIGSGMGLVGHSRQRTNGSGVAQERLERARNVPYTSLALQGATPPPRVEEEGHPDNKVTSDGKYEVEGGTPEPLVMGGTLPHVDDPFTVGNTEFVVYQYVTWVDDPVTPAITDDYKRVTVVVRWKFPVVSGPSHTVTMSTFVGDGNVTVPAIAPPPAGGGGGGGTTTTQLGIGIDQGPLTQSLGLPPGDPADCPAENPNNPSPPVITKMQAITGAGSVLGYQRSQTMQVLIEGTDLECQPLSLWMSNVLSDAHPTDPAQDCDNQSSATHYVQVLEGLIGSPTPGQISVVAPTWQLEAGDGVKAVCATLRNELGGNTGRSRAWGFNVVLDTTPPTVPQNFRQTSCSSSGTQRTVAFAWDAATDPNANLRGYKLYRKIEDRPEEAVATVTGTTATDTEGKNYNPILYWVRALDKAGNETELPVSTLRYRRNDCAPS